MKDNKIHNDEYNELVKVYEEYKKNKKNKLSVFYIKAISACLVAVSNNDISINIYPQSGYADQGTCDADR